VAGRQLVWSLLAIKVTKVGGENLRDDLATYGVPGSSAES